MSTPVTAYPPIYYDVPHGTHQSEDPGNLWFGPFDYGGNQFLMGYSELDFYIRVHKSLDGGLTWAEAASILVDTAQIFPDYRGAGATIYIGIHQATGWATLTFDLSTEVFSGITSLGDPEASIYKGGGYRRLASGKDFFLYSVGGWTIYDHWAVYNSGWESYGTLDATYEHSYAQCAEDANGIVHIAARVRGAGFTRHTRYSQVDPDAGTSTAPQTVSSTTSYGRKGLSPLVFDGSTLYFVADSSTQTELVSVSPITSPAPTISTSAIQSRYTNTDVWLTLIDGAFEIVMNATVDEATSVMQVVYQRSGDMGVTWGDPEVFHDEDANPTFPGVGGQYIHTWSVTRYSNRQIGIAFTLLNMDYASVGVYMAKAYTSPVSGHFAYFGNPVGFGASAGGWFL